MIEIDAQHLLAWAIVAGGMAYWLLTSLGRHSGLALMGATLVALGAKTALLGMG